MPVTFICYSLQVTDARWSSEFNRLRSCEMKEIVAAKYAEIGRKMREIPQQKADTSYEWEELVQKLCVSDDAVLHDIGVRELKILQQICPHCLVFKNI
jgi:hypothetical protein